MEDLTKNQMVLLILLVSFITSLATGIITTSLLTQAPTNVTQTINRVVERTIETVSPSTTSGPSVKEVTVVREEDAIIGSIEQSVDAIVRVKDLREDGTQAFHSLGVVISKDGRVIADKRGSISGSYWVVLPDGSVLPALIEKVDEPNNFIILKIQADASHKTFTSIPVAKNTLKLGQSVIAVQGLEKNSVAIGRVTSTDKGYGTDIPATNEIPGSPLLNLSGELVGLKTSTDDSSTVAGLYAHLNFDSI